MSPRWALSDIEQLGFPRVSGDEPRLLRDAERVGVFSPRERG